jgi:hypothetical protein
MPTLSALFSHPLPAFIVFPPDCVNVGTGRVTREPVGVYVGSSETGPALLMDTGGQTSVLEETETPAPTPPVCHGVNPPVKGFVLPQTPELSRGSSGIQPLSKPSLYDHDGDSTLPETDEFPIFQVQKKKF